MTLTLLRILAPLGLFGWLAWPQLQYLADIWLDDGTYSHGLLLLAVCLWLLWRQRQALAAAPDQPTVLMLVPLALLALGIALSQAVGIDLLARLLLLPALAALAATLFGVPRTRLLLFPLTLLSLALPLWGLLIPALQVLAVAVVGLALDIVAIPAAIHDTYIRIPAGDFEVAQGCSGLRYLLVAAAITALWGHLYMDNWRHRLAYLAAGIAAALVTNWIRIFALIWIGHSSNMESPLMDDHNNFGWYIFAAMLPPLFWLGRRFPEAADGRMNTQVQRRDSSAKAALCISALACAAVLLPQIIRHAEPQAPATIRLPLGPADWQMASPPANGWSPAYAGSDHQLQLHYRNGADAMTLHLLRWSQQDNETDIGQPGNTLIPAGWQLTGSTATGCPDKARCLTVQRMNETRVIIAWHLVNNRHVRGTLDTKKQQLLGAIFGTPGASVVVLEKRCSADCDVAHTMLWHDGKPIVEDILKQLTTKDE